MTTVDLTSTAFQQGQSIPRQCTADGKNISPPLKRSSPPYGTKSFALICEDPDAPRKTWVHWVVYNLPAESRELSEDTPPEATLPNGTCQGVNDFGKIGFGGPAPPPGKPHHYVYRLYALDRPLSLAPGATKDQLLAAIKNHILAEGKLTGIYARDGVAQK